MTGAPYIRFDLLFEDEVQDIGLMMGLDDTGLSDGMCEELLEHFEQHLKIPPTVRTDKRCAEHYPACYFTNEGYQRHKEHIDKIIQEIVEMDNEWSVRTIIRETIPEEHLYYEDEDQAVIRTDSEFGIQSSIQTA
jgi:hypothetical protein